MDPITLASGPARLVLAPRAGGAIARYFTTAGGGAAMDWLRPAPAPGGDDPSAMACYPLVPFSNRIRDGRFRFGGRTVALPRNHPGIRHPLHGHGWRSPWTPVEVDGATALLEYRHAPDPWPWAYRARQRFVLAPDHLAVSLELANESPEPMPAGLGFHPFFPRTPATVVHARVAGVWLTDDEVLPLRHVAPPPAAQDPGRGLQAARVALDHCFTGWDSHAVIEWPERAARLVLAAAAPLATLVLYTPPGADFLCAEPVSHVTDAVNLAAAGRADTGLVALAPGATLAATMTLAPRA